MSNKKKVCMFVMNPVVSDPRVTREAAAVGRAGYEVVIIGISKDRRTEIRRDDYRIVQLRKPVILRFMTWFRDRYFPGGQPSPPQTKAPGVPSRSFTALLRLTVTKMLFDGAEVFSDALNGLFMMFEGIRQRAALYHSHDLNTLFPGYLCSRFRRAKLVYDFHEAFAEQYAPGVKSSLWKGYHSILERLLMGRADGRITVCDSLHDWARDRYGTDDVRVIMNVSKYTAVPAAAGTNAPNVVLYHGGYAKDRGIEQLIESFRYVKQARLVLRGWGPIEGSLRAIAREAGIEDRVVFAPPVKMEELIQAATAADIGVIPYIATSLNNKFSTPNKLFEYIMAGLAIAGSDLPELRRIILGNELGQVFDPTDPRDIARALSSMLSDPERLSQMKRNSLRAAKEKYNWEQESRKLTSLYGELCAE